MSGVDSVVILASLQSMIDAEIPITGSGEVMSEADAQAKFEADAALVQVFSGLVYCGPGLMGEIVDPQNQ